MIKKAGVTTLISVLAAYLAACGVGEAKVVDVIESLDALPLPVEASTPHRADIYANYQTTGALESDSEAPVLARISGEVVEIMVEEGAVVEKGQILALLDGERSRLEMLQAKAKLDQVKREYERLLGLKKRGLVSTAMYEGLRFDMQGLEASYKLKRLDYSYTRIRAPIAGVISSREIKIGGQVNINDPIFRITDTSRLVARLMIPQTELAKFSTGQSIKLSVDAMPEMLFAATIDRISPVIDVRNGTFRATAYIDNDQGMLAPGMFARFSIAYEKHADALVIPVDALVNEDNIDLVYVVVEGAAVRRVIRTGIQSGGMVEVLSGLDISESVVTAGQSGLRDGSPVLANNPSENRTSG